MAHPGAYRGTKRQKELKRLQKQEEKRLKRLQKGPGGTADDGVPEFPLDGPILPEGQVPEALGESEPGAPDDHPTEPEGTP